MPGPSRGQKARRYTRARQCLDGTLEDAWIPSDLSCGRVVDQYWLLIGSDSIILTRVFSISSRR